MSGERVELRALVYIGPRIQAFYVPASDKSRLNDEDLIKQLSPKVADEDTTDVIIEILKTRSLSTTDQLKPTVFTN